MNYISLLLLKGGFSIMCSGVNHIALLAFLDIVGLIRIHLNVWCPWSLSIPFFFNKKNSIQSGCWNKMQLLLGYCTVAGAGQLNWKPGGFARLECFLGKENNFRETGVLVRKCERIATKGEEMKLGKELPWRGRGNGVTEQAHKTLTVQTLGTEIME